MDISVIDNPIYPPHEKYRMRFVFSSNYPIEAPEVVFQYVPSNAPGGGPGCERKIPLHPHIYSNGIICLDLLDRQGWSPVHNVESICISIQSMLAGNTKAEREQPAPNKTCAMLTVDAIGPPGDADFVKHNRQRPRDINFLYHDPKV